MKINRKNASANRAENDEKMFGMAYGCVASTIGLETTSESNGTTGKAGELAAATATTTRVQQRFLCV